MFRSEVQLIKQTPFTSKDRIIVRVAAITAILQCTTVFILGTTVVTCVWHVDDALFTLDLLMRIMYLYEADMCGQVRDSEKFRELNFVPDTKGYNVLPLVKIPPPQLKAPKLASAMITHVQISFGVHVCWMMTCIFMLVVCYISDVNFTFLEYSLLAFIYSYYIICIFDVCMSIVYVSHIQMSLNIGMIMRYSGWVRLPMAVRKQDFGGWVPIVMSGLWLRGVLIFALNVYLTGLLKTVKRNISGREFQRRQTSVGNKPFPQSTFSYDHNDKDTLYYKRNEEKALNFRKIPY